MTYLPFIGFAFVFIIFCSIIFSRKGRNLAIKTEFGGNVKEDLGEVAEYKIFAGHQKLRLLKCQDQQEEVYIIEADTTLPARKEYYWTRIDKESLRKINSLIK